MTRKIILALASSFVLAACAHHEPAPPPAAPPPAPAPAKPAEPPSTPDEPFRAQKPEALPVTPHFQAPVPVQKKLKNGLTVLINENHQVPLVVAELVVKTGVDGNPLNQPGLAEFTAAMLDEGTQKRSALELAEQLENLAAQLSATTTLDSTRVHLNCLTETLPQALDLMSDVSLHPAFKQADIDRVKKRYLTELAQRAAVPAFIATDTANRVLYGEKHPWGAPEGGTPEAVSKLGTKDLQKFHAANFVPGNAVLTVSGDVKADELLALLEKSFGSWKGKAAAVKKAPLPPAPAERYIAAVDHPGSQSRVLVVQRMLKATDPDVVPFKTGNYILGGLFSSRLNLNLREEKAFSYGVRSGITFNDLTGVFQAGGNIIAQHTPEAISEMEKEFTRFSNGEVTPEELNAAKSAYVRSLPSQLETNDAVASSIGSLVMQGLPLDYYAKLPDQVAAVSAQDVARVAKKYVTPQTWPVIAVGPVAAQKDKLEALKLGPVKPVAAPQPAMPQPGAPRHGDKPAAKPAK